MKKNNFLTITLAVFFVLLSVHGVSAQEAGNPMSISGDEICGASATAECSITDLRSIFAGVIKLLIWVGIPAMVMFIGVRLILAYLDLIQGKTMDFKKAGAQIWQAIFGFFVVVAVSTGLFYGMLKTFGAQDWATSLARLLSSSSSKPTTPTATTTPPSGR